MLFFKRIEHPTSLFKDRVIEVGSVDHPGIGQARSRRRFGASCCAGHYATTLIIYVFRVRKNQENDVSARCLANAKIRFRSLHLKHLRIFSFHFSASEPVKALLILGHRKQEDGHICQYFPSTVIFLLRIANLNTKLISSIFMRISKSYFSTMWENDHKCLYYLF